MVQPVGTVLLNSTAPGGRFCEPVDRKSSAQVRGLPTANLSILSWKLVESVRQCWESLNECCLLMPDDTGSGMRSMSALLQLCYDSMTLSHSAVCFALIPSGKETRKVENNNLADAWLQNFLFESQEMFLNKKYRGGCNRWLHISTYYILLHIEITCLAVCCTCELAPLKHLNHSGVGNIV